MHISPFMKFFYLCPDDRDWLKRWLMKHGILLLLILCFWVILHAWPKVELPNAGAGDSSNTAMSGTVVSSRTAMPPSAIRKQQNQARVWIPDGQQSVQLVTLPLGTVHASEFQSAGPSLGGEPFRVAGAVVAVQPRGWRRTRDGWENSTTWGTSLASLGDIVRQQQEREPGWVKALLAGVRSIPPWAYAMFQILAITCILLFERRATYHPGSE